MGGMPVTKTTSTPPSSGSGEWTPEKIIAWMCKVKRQDEASARIRRSLGQIVTEPDHWRRSHVKTVQSSTMNG